MSADEHIAAAIRATVQTVHAPPNLRERLADQGTSRRRSRPWRLAPTLAVAAALGLVAVLSQVGAPSVHHVARAALNAPTQPPPKPDPADPRYTTARVGTVRFPDYAARWGWRTAGARTDRVAGRRALTVVYRKAQADVHYTVVDGPPLDLPPEARRVDAAGLRLAVVRDSGAAVVAWHAGGHTCVVASRTVDADRLIEFAAWSRL